MIKNVHVRKVGVSLSIQTVMLKAILFLFSYNFTVYIVHIDLKRRFLYLHLFYFLILFMIPRLTLSPCGSLTEQHGMLLGM